jgi:hypothetical protein
MNRDRGFVTVANQFSAAAKLVEIPGWIGHLPLIVT